MTVEKIRQFVMDHPEIYSAKNTDGPMQINSGKRYYFIGLCKHEFLAFPSNVIKDDRILCPVCSGHQIQAGVNDLWTTYPILAQKLLNPEEGYGLTAGSNKKVKWKCPDCGFVFEQQVNKMKHRKNFCTSCGNRRSYGEKYISCFLDQLCEIYSSEQSFDWSDRKVYDFYLPIHNCIIEVHGKQHYEKSFDSLGGRTLEEEQNNDEYKYYLAKKHGVREYIVLNCSQSDPDVLKNEILSSLLPTLLMFEEEDIDWLYCHEYAISSLAKKVCECYQTEEKTIQNLCEEFGRSRNTIVAYLKQGNKFGWCTYDPQENKRKANEKK